VNITHSSSGFTHSIMGFHTGKSLDVSHSISGYHAQQQWISRTVSVNITHSSSGFTHSIMGFHTGKSLDVTHSISGYHAQYQHQHQRHRVPCRGSGRAGRLAPGVLPMSRFWHSKGGRIEERSISVLNFFLELKGVFQTIRPERSSLRYPWAGCVDC
jgi:hypothetical protein